MSKRRYTLAQRAESQEETRRRIVEATVRLHEELGPREASISAIARAAGVQRLTVYRHFPDEAELFRACTAHWLKANPPPDPQGWAGLEGVARVREALTRLYGYFRATDRMWTVSYRDVAEVPALQAPMRQFEDYLDRLRDDLAGGIDAGAESAPRSRATLGAAVRFPLWQALAREGLDDGAMAGLVCAWLEGIGG